MHESGLAERLLAAVLAAAPPGGRRIRRVEVEAGPLALPSADALAFHFVLAAAGTLAEGAEVRVVGSAADPGGIRLVAIEVADEPVVEGRRSAAADVPRPYASRA